LTSSQSVDLVDRLTGLAPLAEVKPATQHCARLHRKNAFGLSSISAFVTYCAAVGASYFAQLVIARAVGATSYGYYSYVLAWTTILAYVAALGFDVSLLRLVASYKAGDAWALVKGVIRYAECRSAACGVAIALLGVAAIATFGDARDTELNTTFILGFMVVPILALLWIRAAAVRALGGVMAALIPDRLVRDGLLLVLVWFAARIWNGRMDATFVMSGTLTSALAGLALVSVMKRRWTPLSLDRAAAAASAAPMWRRTALPLVLIAVAESAMNRTGIVLLGWEGHTSEAGVFALIFNVTSIVVLPRVAVNTRFAPMVSELFTTSNRAALQLLTAKATGWSLFGGAVIALPLWLTGEWILSQFGAVFQVGLVPLRILLFTQLIAAGAGSQIFLMTMTGHERSAALIVTLSAIGNVLLAAMLINRCGIIGAAVASGITLVIMNVIMATVIRIRLGLAPGAVALVTTRRLAKAS
jgi:O-antigen/teichoic acid export membrane protein